MNADSTDTARSAGQHRPGIVQVEAADVVAALRLGRRNGSISFSKVANIKMSSCKICPGTADCEAIGPNATRHPAAPARILGLPETKSDSPKCRQERRFRQRIKTRL